MAFVLKPISKFIWPVTIRLPVAGGKYDEHVLNLEFEPVPEKEMAELMKKPATTDRTICETVVCGWQDVQDEGGKAVEFNKKSFEALLKNPSISSQIATAYMEIFQKAVEKN